MIHYEASKDPVLKAIRQTQEDARQEFIQAKLSRIMQFLYGEWQQAFYAKQPDVVAYWHARADVARCRRDVKYEYLGLRDSWL